MTQQATNSVYRRGAEDGFWFGIYFSVLFLLMANAMTSMLCNFIALAMCMGVPILLFLMLFRAYKADNLKSTLSTLWVHGICIFFFGSLILVVVAYVYMRFINPMFISQVINMAVETYIAVDTDESRELAEQFIALSDSGALPSAAQTAISMIWTAVFTGSLLSLVESVIIRACVRRRTTPPPPPSL